MIAECRLSNAECGLATAGMNADRSAMEIGGRMRLAPRLVEHFNWLTHHWPSRQAFQTFRNTYSTIRAISIPHNRHLQKPFRAC